MVRHVSSRRALLAGLVFFVLVVGGSLLYRWHVHRTTETELKRSAQILQHLEQQNETHSAEAVTVKSEGELDGNLRETPEASLTTDEGDSAETEAFSSDAEYLDVTAAELPEDFTLTEELHEDVQESPFGFGPYPEIPEDYPENLIPPWAGSQNPPGYASGNELLDRVLIKLWTQGDKGFTGGSTGNGKVYPHYPNTLYVRYKEIPLPDGTVLRRITRMKGGPDMAQYATQLREGNPPAHLRLLDFDTSGIDPYTFLKTGD